MSTKIDILKEVVEKGSKEQTIMVLESIENALASDDTLVQEITDPKTITGLHEAMIEHLGVNPRAMKLKARPQTRKRRALMFVRAMKNGVEKSGESE